ncbi:MULTISPECIES: ABC transporter permease [Paenibacillus]|uniref:ABC transporter permease n=1 Tax=Paenibacillus TaxID=44249 RepID=UPI00096ED847|nr:ABC transporter permease subunit [Paenibacillus peoriae]OMF70428.1 sugar ABC transporter permease [Paenibacillus peoriae]OMF81428.1 sugar ABC transporter permease [Paenibacillus peoriae]
MIPMYVMMLPGLLYLLINNYIPMAGLFIAFKSTDFSKGIFQSDWVGFENFKYLFSTSDAWVITRNTILYNVVFIILGTVLGVVVGILLSELTSKFLSRFYQTVLLLPQLMSIIIVAYIAYAFLSMDTGLINNTILPLFGIDPISWYMEPSYWPYILTFIYLWKGLGYSCIIYLASILGIDKSLYESAEIDGAGKWRQTLSITLPMLKPTIITLVLMSVGRIFYADFGLFYQIPMNSGALYDTTNVIDTYVYRGLLQMNDIGMASAAGAYQSVVGFVVILLANYIVRKLDKDNALF